MAVKLELMDDFKASMEVRIPTIAMIPNAIISMVRIMRKIFALMAPLACLMFSRRFNNQSI